MKKSNVKHNMNFFAEKDYQEIIDLFHLIDYENKGFIMVQDVLDILDAVGYESRTNLLYQILNSLKVNGLRKIYQEEFKDIMTKKLGVNGEEDDLKIIFGVYKQNSKFIDLDTLRRISKELGENLDDDDLRRMIKIADSNEDGIVDYDDFYDVMMSDYDADYFHFFDKKVSN